MGVFRRVFSSDLSIVRLVIAEVMEFFSETVPDMSVEDLGDLRLIISELLANAVIHGNQQDCHKDVIIEAEVTETEVYCAISDEGKGFDYVNEMGCPYKVRIRDDHGRGLELVRSISDGLGFNETGSKVYISKRLYAHV